MTLEINLVPIIILTITPEEMIKTYLIKSCSRGIGRNMSPNTAFVFIGTNNHSHGIPADKAFYSSFNFPVAREGGLFCPRNSVYVRSICSKRDTNPCFMCSDLELL